MSGISEDNFGRIWPAHIVNLTAFLVRLRDAFDGDLEAALIMAVIGSAMLPRGGTPKNLTYSGLRDFDANGEHYKPLNSFSIAQISEIPRETVRRKLLHMERRGWISKDPRGHWHVESAGARAMKPVTQYSLDYLNRMAAIILSACDAPVCTDHDLEK